MHSKCFFSSSVTPLFCQALERVMIIEINCDFFFCSSDSLADFEVVRLQEDITLAGFTPLMYNVPEPIFTHKDRDMEEAQVRPHPTSKKMTRNKRSHLSSLPPVV